LTTTLTNSFLTAQIKHFGAELCSLRNKQNREYIWEANTSFWGKHSPILFPIIGALKNDSYLFENASYSLSRHGFARDMNFELISKTENCATFSIHSTEETLKNFPFKFELQVIYTLQENQLKISYKVVNTGNSELPFSIGAHPAFALTKDFDNYSIEFEKEELLESALLDRGLICDKTQSIVLKNKQIPLSYELFEIDTLIFKKMESKTITLLEQQVPMLRVNFMDFPNLGIWTLKNAPFLCIEPWFGYADTTNNTGNIIEKEGIQILETQGTFHSVYSIEIF
jgi:galactose mutarotase-like enzyme